jgi:hypothetical protein
VKQIKELAEELADAYSTDSYKGGWSGCVRMLRKRGYSDHQIEAIVRSKWTRWAGDFSDRPYGYRTSTDLASFLDSMKDKERSEVEALTREHWGGAE